MKPKILILYYKNFFPINSGDKNVISNHIDILSESYKVDLLHFPARNTANENQPQKNINKIISFKSKTSKKLLNLMKHYSPKYPIQTAMYYNQKTFNWIKAHKDDYYAFYPHFFRSAELVRKLHKNKVLHMHDAISLNYRTALNHKIPLIKKFLYKMEINKLIEYEKKCIADFNRTLLVSDFDRNYLIENNADKNKLTKIPISVSKKLLDYKKTDNSDSITFLGKMDYLANVDAMKYFVNKIFPFISQNINLKILGSSPAKDIQKLENERISVSGYIEDPYTIIKNSKIFVAPMRMGSGTQLKVLEAMALGKCVIASGIVKHGIDATNGKEIVYAENSEDFIDKINYYLKNDDKRKQIGKNARAFIKKNHTNQVIKDLLLDLFSNLKNN
ncbi:MAG: glycosyltransferase [Candidatus Mcinerneyibacterium aminivorans]|uniref:Glycosyltransferase n=1 Tax=Candidatus Mcinerneyibacterium aminivorans TaxID=2703815 RepID=A0A5D0MGH6_9BACT|nr:MAG: glycosyltransferase [Candidatus Mcinerneyibacterium aminivorans]